MNKEEKVVPAPVVPGPVISQAMPAAADPGAGLAPTPPDAQIELSQVPWAVWVQGNSPRGNAVASPLR